MRHFCQFFIPESFGLVTLKYVQLRAIYHELQSLVCVVSAKIDHVLM